MDWNNCVALIGDYIELDSSVEVEACKINVLQ